MEYQPFIVKVPAGEGHQEYCTIFNGHMLPRSPEERPREDDRRYQISIEPGLLVAGTLIVGQEDLLGKLEIRGNKVNLSSMFRPQIALRHRVTGLLEATAAADFLETTFHDLHWVGLTPDRVVRYIAKRLLVQPFDYKTRHQKGTGLRLVAVEMDVDDIEASLKDLSTKWRQEQEARFGA